MKKAAETGASVYTLANWLLNACTTERGLGSWEAATVALGLELCSFSRPLRRLSTSQGVTVVVDDPMRDDDSDADGAGQGSSKANTPLVERSVIIKILLRVKTLDYHMYMYGNKLCIKGKKQSYGINALNA